ncbi:MAG TPA: amidohydrolase family protein [Myxococcota bacterium]|nr:amidohydrolase family protein [Myxococcota bacterium]
MTRGPDGRWMISSDSHIVEPPDLWTSRMPKRLAERAPRVVSLDDGDWWFVDGRKTQSFVGIQAGVRFGKDPGRLVTSARFEQVRPAAYDPRRYLAENEQDGVFGSVIYPSEGLVIFSVPNTEIVTAAMRAYNDWLAEFCAEDPSRLKGLAMLNVDEVDEAVAELERVARLGLAGALVTVKPPAWAPFRSRAYDALWAAAQDLSLPLSLHVATDRGDPRGGDAAFTLDVKNVPPAVFINKDHQVRQALADLILEGVFERFPRLRVGSVEHELGWIPFFLAQMDYTYTDRPARGEWHRFRDGLLPSEFWHRNCFASFQEDAIGVRLRDVIGVPALLWGSDYPHTESTFPRSREIVAEILADVPEGEARAIVAENAARLYGFALPD